MNTRKYTEEVFEDMYSYRERLREVTKNAAPTMYMAMTLNELLEYLDAAVAELESCIEAGEYFQESML